VELRELHPGQRQDLPPRARKTGYHTSSNHGRQYRRAGGQGLGWKNKFARCPPKCPKFCISITMDKLELFNALIVVVTPVNSMGAHAASLDDSLSGTGLDSLDLLMMGIYLGDIYGVEEEELKLLQPTTVKDMFDFMEQRKTKEIPQTVQEALGMVL